MQAYYLYCGAVSGRREYNLVQQQRPAEVCKLWENLSSKWTNVEVSVAVVSVVQLLGDATKTEVWSINLQQLVIPESSSTVTELRYS